MSAVDKDLVEQLVKCWHGVTPTSERVSALVDALTPLSRAIDDIAGKVDITAEPSNYESALERLAVRRSGK